jgi:hypothetical protein
VGVTPLPLVVLSCCAARCLRATISHAPTYIAASFVQGPPPAECLSGDITDDQFQALRVSYLGPAGAGSGGSAASKKRKRMLLATNDTVTYEARNYGDEAGGKPAYKYVVA